MSENREIIKFRIARIATDQFAVIEQAYAESIEINLSTNLRFAVERDKNLVAVVTSFKFEQKGNPFLLIEVSCHFSLAKESWDSLIKENMQIVLPKDFMCHLATITVGTTRGVLHAKTEGTRFNGFFLPTINVKELIKEDVSFGNT